MNIPKEIQKDFLAYMSRNVDAAKKARKSIRELDELACAAAHADNGGQSEDGQREILGGAEL